MNRGDVAPLPQPQVVPIMADPFITALVKDVIRPKFSGRPEDFLEFSIEWDRYLGIITLDKGRELPEFLKMEILGGSLDPTNKVIMRAEQEKGITYRGFWEQLERRYLSDIQEYHRAKWHQVKLQLPLT